MGTVNGETNGVQKHGDMRDYVAPSLFQPHLARQAIRDAHEKKIPPLLGYFQAIPSIHATRWIAPMGYDCVWIDWEHSAFGVETMTTMVHEIMFMSGGKTIPFVRTPSHDHASIGYILDAGASLIIPQVDTVEQAKYVVSCAKYGSAAGGTRSAPPFRLYPGLTDAPAYPKLGLHKSLNEQAAIMIQIESLEGINNLDAILTEVPEIDAVFLGRLDARVNMNLPGGIGMPETEPEWHAAVEKLMATVKKHNKPFSGGAFSKGEQFKKEVMDQNMSICWIEFDALALMSMQGKLMGAREALGSK